MLAINDGVGGSIGPLPQTPRFGATEPDPALFNQAIARAQSKADSPAAGQTPAQTVGPAACGAPGDNHFERKTVGPDPNLAVGGSHDEQEHQRDVTLLLAGPSWASYATGQIPGAPRFPFDSQTQDILGKLDRNPPIGRDGEKVTHTVYQSHIPNASADEAYRHFVENPEEVFGAGGMEIRPPAGGLENNGRYMLETGGPPPVWLPVEITLDPAKRALTIHTLDGHPLRGEQTFTFKDDGNGGTNLTQDARYQASSTLVGELQQVASISDGQHSAWEHAHQEIYRQFNCDPGYEGIGTSALSPELLQADLDLVSKALLHPFTTAGALVGTAGVVANAGIDWAGVAANAALDLEGATINRDLDRMGIPGGDAIEAGADVAGNAVRMGADVAGDAIKIGGGVLGIIL